MKKTECGLFFSRPNRGRRSAVGGLRSAVGGFSEPKAFFSKATSMASLIVAIFIVTASAFAPLTSELVDLLQVSLKTKRVERLWLHCGSS